MTDKFFFRIAGGSDPELNCEYPEPGEDKLIEKMLMLAAQRMKPQQGRIRRGQHAKATGCVRGVFTIRDDVPADLRYGVFEKPNQLSIYNKGGNQ